MVQVLFVRRSRHQRGATRERRSVRYERGCDRKHTAECRFVQ